MALDLNRFAGIVDRVKTPLTLAGLALLIFYGILSKVLDLQVFAPLQEANTAATLERVLTYTFVLAIVCVVLGGLSFILGQVLKPSGRA